MLSPPPPPAPSSKPRSLQSRNHGPRQSPLQHMYLMFGRRKSLRENDSGRRLRGPSSLVSISLAMGTSNDVSLADILSKVR